jgi:C1A family cysteine protease
MRHVPVLLVIRLTDSFHYLKAPWIITNKGQGTAVHAVVAAGLGLDERRRSLVLIRNSWGRNWGDGGHGWLPIAYLRDKLIEWATLTVKTPGKPL